LSTSVEKLAKITNNRRRILEALKKLEGLPSTITKLAKETGMDKSSVSKDVKKLEELGFVRTGRKGRENLVCLTSEGWGAFKESTAKVVKRSFEDILAKAENTADELIGKRLGLPPFREVRTRFEKELKLHPFEALLEDKQ